MTSLEFYPLLPVHIILMALLLMIILRTIILRTIILILILIGASTQQQQLLQPQKQPLARSERCSSGQTDVSPDLTFGYTPVGWFVTRIEQIVFRWAIGLHECKKMLAPTKGATAIILADGGGTTR